MSTLQWAEQECRIACRKTECNQVENQMGNTIERCEVVNDLNGGGVKAVRLTDGRYVTEKLARELAADINDKFRP